MITPSWKGPDFDAPKTDYDVTEEGALTGVDIDNWVEASLNSAYVGDVATTDRTQFRVYFDHLDDFDDTAAAWYSSESAGNEPQLIVPYEEAE